MSKKAIGIISIFLLLYFFIFNTAGSGMAIMVMAIGILAEAVLFTIRPEYQNKWIKFMNPSIYNAYSKKGIDYIKRKNKINVIMYYILFIVMAFNGAIQLKHNNNVNSINTLNFKEYFITAAVIIVMVVLLNFIYKFIINKSKSPSQELGWDILLGVIFAVIIISVISIYMVNKVFVTGILIS